MSLLDNPSLTTSFGIYPIMDEGVREEFHRDDSRVEWTIVCRWTDRAGLIFQLLGGAALIGGAVVTTTPYFHPLYPWFGAMGISVEGVPGADGITVGAGAMAAYRYARLKVTFAPLEVRDGKEFGADRIDYSVRVVTVPDSTFGFGAGTNRINLRGAECPGILFPRATLQRTILRQPSIPVATIFSLLGMVNGSPFLGGDTATVLFSGCSSERTFDPQGNKTWQICYQLVYDSKGWNKYMVPGSGTNSAAFVDLTDSNGAPPYLLGDLTLLGFTS